MDTSEPTTPVPDDPTARIDQPVASPSPTGEQFVQDLNQVPGFRCESPAGAFYAWVDIRDTGVSAEQICRVLLEEAGVAHALCVVDTLGNHPALRLNAEHLVRRLLTLMTAADVEALHPDPG